MFPKDSSCIYAWVSKGDFDEFRKESDVIIMRFNYLNFPSALIPGGSPLLDRGRKNKEILPYGFF